MNNLYCQCLLGILNSTFILSGFCRMVFLLMKAIGQKWPLVKINCFARFSLVSPVPRTHVFNGSDSLVLFAHVRVWTV